MRGVPITNQTVSSPRDHDQEAEAALPKAGRTGRLCGRRPGPSQTREQIIRAAREQFAERGYTHTTLRSVAAAAHVHPGLLHHYFGSKQQLYREALDLPVDPWEVLTRLLAGTPRDQFADALVRQFVSTWRDPASGARLRALVRRAHGDPDGTSMARAHLETVLIPRFASALDVPEANVAAALSHLIGLTLLDTLLGVDQLSNLSDDDLVALIGPAISRYLTPGKQPARRTPLRRR
jgi:AcrR family transcriptional regulator